MEDNLVGPKGSNTLVYFVLGALVVAVAVLAFFALGGKFSGGNQPVPQPIIVTPPAPVPAPAPTHDDHHDRNDRNGPQRP